MKLLQSLKLILHVCFGLTQNRPGGNRLSIESGVMRGIFTRWLRGFWPIYLVGDQFEFKNLLPTMADLWRGGSTSWEQGFVACAYLFDGALKIRLLICRYILLSGFRYDWSWLRRQRCSVQGSKTETNFPAGHLLVVLAEIFLSMWPGLGCTSSADVVLHALPIFAENV